jgi:electron transfer flavoprotein alpha subunit
MPILLLAEHDNFQLKTDFLKVLGAARQLSNEVHVLVIGYKCSVVAEHVASVKGVDQVLMADDAIYEHHPEDRTSLVIKQISEGYSHILSSSSSFGKAVLPRVAAYLDVAQISSVSAIVSTDIFIRPTYAGRLLCTVKSNDHIKVLTVIAAAFSSILEKQLPSPIVNIPHKPVKISNYVVFVRSIPGSSNRKPLQSANTIVAAGRGLSSQENFDAVELLADTLDASVGATRAVVDAGWMSNDQQIGQTAKTVSPQLYIALGISGAAQHLAGMKDSKVIVAVNKDPDAPILKVANYALVADLNDVMPHLNDLLQDSNEA